MKATENRGWDQAGTEGMVREGKPLQKMFNRIPGRYDFLNHLMTMGLDQIWRKKAAARIIDERPRKVMDLGTGTGDMALYLASKIPDAKVTGCDFSAPMLKVAERKAKRKKINNVTFIEGDAANIPFERNSFDVVVLSFAFRNMVYKNRNNHLYIKEVFRILKPGGKLICLESSQPQGRFVRFLFHKYMKLVPGGIAKNLSGYKEAYFYLTHSVMHFHYRDFLLAFLHNHGFHPVKYHPMFFGVVAITTARKSGAAGPEVPMPQTTDALSPTA